MVESHKHSLEQNVNPAEASEQQAEVIEFPGAETAKEKEQTFENVDTTVLNQTIKLRNKDLPPVTLQDVDEVATRHIVDQKFREYAKQNIIDTSLAAYMDTAYDNKITEHIGKSNSIDATIVNKEEYINTLEEQARQAEQLSTKEGAEQRKAGAQKVLAEKTAELSSRGEGKKSKKTLQLEQQVHVLRTVAEAPVEDLQKEAEEQHAALLDEIEQTKQLIEDKKVELDTEERAIEKLTQEKDIYKQHIDVRPLFLDIVEKLEAEEKVAALQSEKEQIERTRAMIQAGGKGLSEEDKFTALNRAAEFEFSGSAEELAKFEKEQAEQQTLEALRTGDFKKADMPTLQRFYDEGTLTEEQFKALPIDIQFNIIGGAPEPGAETPAVAELPTPTERASADMAAAQAEQTPPPQKKGLLRRIFGREKE
jgi:hypothetical protein